MLAGALLLLVLAAAAVIAVLTETPMLLLAAAFGLAIVAAGALAVAYKRAIRLLIATRDNTRTTAALAKAAAAQPAPQPQAAMVVLPKPSIGALEWISANTTFTTSQLVNRLTQMRSTSGRDILAFKVTRGMWDWSDMERALESYRLGGSARKRVQAQLDACVPLPAAQLADLCFRQNITPMDRLNAASLYRIILKKHGTKLFDGKRRAEFVLDSFASSALREEGLKLMGLYTREDKRHNDVELFRANFTNPFRYEDVDPAGWLDSVNAMYRSEGLAELELLPGDQDPFLRLSAAPVAPVVEGPLVSILMPVYQPDAATELAIRSALAQSYRNIELIIVDDGSGEPFTSALSAWAGQDPRVTVVLNPVNAGAYTSRNMAFTKASGEYVTVFDGDDWQHPQKIEKLVAAAAGQADNRMVSAPWARVDSDLFFHYRGWRGAFITPSHVSTMFPVSAVRDNLGHWDSVRKAADTEFILRYQLLVNPEEALEVTEAPLTLSLVGASNLSVDDFRLGYRAPDRRSYRESYALWHRRIEASETTGYLPFPLPTRAFAAPPRYRPVRTPAAALDVLLVGDFRSESQSTQRLLAHLEELRNGSSRIGLLHRPSLMHSVSLDSGFSDEVLDAFDAGELQRVEVTDMAAAATVLIYDPSGFQFATALPSRVQAERVLLLAGQEPETAKGHRYEVTAVMTNIQSTFGVPPQWIPLREELYRKLQGLLPAGALLERTWGSLEQKLAGASGDVWPSARKLAAVDVPELVMESVDAGA